jgi:hypothetical protein
MSRLSVDDPRRSALEGWHDMKDVENGVSVEALQVLA